jgi:hypothetical protein
MPPEEQPLSLDLQVLRRIKGTLFKSLEVMEAERPEDMAPFKEGGDVLYRWAATLDRQGVILAHLSAIPETKAELMSRMPGLVNCAPVWLDARLVGVTQPTAVLFLRGLAETLGIHRIEIERVVAEQVVDPEDVEAALEEATPPPGAKDETQSQLIHGVGQAMMAHTKALVEIAYDLEMQIGHRLILDC